jgi:hypothetical protein
VPELCRCGDWQAESKGLWEQTRGLEQAAAGTGERWSEAEAARFYQTVLKDAGKIANLSVGKGFEEQRQRTWGEFEAFVQKVGGGLTVENARGIDIVAFVHGEWIPGHSKKCWTTVGPAKRKSLQLQQSKG